MVIISSHQLNTFSAGGTIDHRVYSDGIFYFIILPPSAHVLLCCNKYNSMHRCEPLDAHSTKGLINKDNFSGPTCCQYCSNGGQRKQARSIKHTFTEMT